VLRSNGSSYRVSGGLLAQTSRPDGRLEVKLSRDNSAVTALVHQLVLFTFVGPRPPGQEGCHWDGDNQNNHLTNLRWDTSLANSADQRRHGTHWNTAKTECTYGHRLAFPNLRAGYWEKYDRRGCLACHRANTACRNALARKGILLDFQTEADWRYEEIMRGQLAVEAS